MKFAKESEKPVVSIVTVCDYKAGHEGAWDDMRATLLGLQAQDFEQPVEVLLVEATAAGMSIPDEIKAILPQAKLIQAEGQTSYDLKNAGANASQSDWVVILDADCPPHPCWLSALMAHRNAYPEADVISGRTHYRAKGLLSRVFALLDRCYVDAGDAGPTRAISTNNSAFLRTVLLQYPMLNTIGPYGSKRHSDALLAAGKTLHFEPEMLAFHAYGGWEMARAVRKDTGYSMAMYRVVDPLAKYAALYRLRELGIPFIFGMSFVDSCLKCVKHRTAYNIKWYELPYAWSVAFRAHLLEIPGLREGMHSEQAKPFVAYR